MKLMDLLQEKLEKKIGDEWVGKDGREYKMDKDGILVNQDDIWKRVTLSNIDKNIENIKEVWKPKIKDVFYLITSIAGELIVYKDIYGNAIADNNRIAQNNYFKTKEEAEEKLEQILGVLNETN